MELKMSISYNIFVPKLLPIDQQFKKKIICGDRRIFFWMEGWNLIVRGGKIKRRLFYLEGGDLPFSPETLMTSVEASMAKAVTGDKSPPPSLTPCRSH
jgi:hypothetical protein